MKTPVFNAKQVAFIWITDDRNRNKVTDFELGDRTKKTCQRLYSGIARTHGVNYLCTDGLDVYRLFKYSSSNLNK
ncbi:MAG: hypothetical protein LBI29_00065 [Rickettsiales bacterium]|jgi:IS1 family transposase|nr:hypothetical protein [Rickettsiales bacterium]